MDFEKEISEIVSQAIQIDCEIRDADSDALITNIKIYPLPATGDILYPAITYTEKDYKKICVVSRHYKEKTYSWDNDCGWIIYAREVK